MSLANIQVDLRRNDRQLQVEMRQESVQQAVIGATRGIEVDLQRAHPPLNVQMPTPGGSTVDLARNITNYSVKASFDPDNRSRLGSDGGIYTPELTADPLAYYILAKA